MDEELCKSVESLRQIAPRLNAITEEAAKTVEAVERFLNDECSAGIRSYVPVEVDEKYGSEAGTCLAYKRVGDRFRIAVVEAGPDGEDESTKPWADCSRAVRLDTFRKLPELLTRVASNVESRLKETEKTSSTVRAILQALAKK